MLPLRNDGILAPPLVPTRDRRCRQHFACVYLRHSGAAAPMRSSMLVYTVLFSDPPQRVFTPLYERDNPAVSRWRARSQRRKYEFGDSFTPVLLETRTCVPRQRHVLSPQGKKLDPRRRNCQDGSKRSPDTARAEGDEVRTIPGSVKLSCMGLWGRIWVSPDTNLTHLSEGWK